MLFIYMQIRQTRFRCDEITEDVLECKTRTQPVWLHPLKIQINIWLGTSTFVFTDFHCRRNCVCLFKSDPTLEFNPLQPNTVTAKDSSCCDPRVRVCVCVWLASLGKSWNVSRSWETACVTVCFTVTVVCLWHQVQREGSEHQDCTAAGVSRCQLTTHFQRRDAEVRQRFLHVCVSVWICSNTYWLQQSALFDLTSPVTVQDDGVWPLYQHLHNYVHNLGGFI